MSTRLKLLFLMVNWVYGQIRKIEKKGILIFSPEELGSQWLQVYCNVVQLPFNLARNYRYNPSVDWYGNYTIMSDDLYALEGKHISFQNQLIFEYRRSLEQFQENVISYFESLIEFLESISLRVNVPVALSYTAVDLIEHPLVPYKYLKFVLAEGCIIQLTCVYLPFEKRVNAPSIEEPPLVPPPPSSPPNLPPGDSDPPTSAPPGEGARHSIAPPYDGQDDNGDTYVPPSINEPLDNPTEYDNSAWKVTVFLEYKNPDGTPFNGLASQNSEAIIWGRYIKTEVYINTAYGIKGTRIQYQRTISSPIEYANIGGQTTDLNVVIKYRVISIVRI